MSQSLTVSKKSNSLKQKLGKIKWGAWFLIIPSLTLLYFLVWRPVFSGMYLSFFQLRHYEPVKFVGLENYKDVVSDTLFMQTLGNTFQYVFWSLIMGYLPPIILAIMVNEVVHFKSAFKVMLYFPSVVPAVAVSILWYFLYYPTASGLLNAVGSLFGAEPFVWLQNSSWTIPLIVLSMTWKGCGGTMIMYLATLQGVNQELYEATKIDGANAWQRLRYVTLPYLFPMMALYLVKQVIGIFQIMQEPLLMTGGGPNNASLSLSLQGYKYAFLYFQPEKALALGTITFIILITLTFVHVLMNKKINN